MFEKQSHTSFNPLPHNPYFWRPWERSLQKTLWEKEKMLVTSIFTFSHCFSTLHKSNFKISVTFILSSANAFDLDKPKVLSFGNELTRLLNKFCEKETLAYSPFPIMYLYPFQDKTHFLNLNYFVTYEYSFIVIRQFILIYNLSSKN